MAPAAQCKRLYHAGSDGGSCDYGHPVFISIKKFDLIIDSASLTALRVGVRELNTRETLVWTNIKLSDDGWLNDGVVYNAVDKKIGQGYDWNPAPTVSGGKLHYKTQSLDLNRDASTNKSTGAWH